MKRALEAAYKEFTAQHEGWDLHMPAGSDWIAPDSHYYTTGASDGREEIDYRPAVHEPAVGKTGLPLLPDEIAAITAKAEKAAQKAGKKLTPNGGAVYTPFASVAPAPLPNPADVAEPDTRLERDAALEMIDAAHERLLQIFDGPAHHRDVLERLCWGWTIEEIAADLDYSTRRIRHIVRGNPQRDEPGLIPWLKKVSQSVPTKAEPIKTKRKSLQDQAIVAQQMAWDFEAMAAGVTV